MWIVPEACETSSLWVSLAENRFFVMQHHLDVASLGERSTSEKAPPSNNLRSNIWGSVVGTLQAMFDVRQAPYRIVLKKAPSKMLSGDRGFTIAVANGKREIDSDWAWVQANLSESAFGMHQLSASDDGNEMDNSSERGLGERKVVTKATSHKEGHHSQPISHDEFGQFVIARIQEEQGRSMTVGTDESATDEKFRATARSFRNIFGLSEGERLVAYYSCSDGSSIFSQGWMYISEHFLSYYSYIMGVEKKILIELKNITELRKERSKKNLLPDAIYVGTVDRHSILFSNLFARDETYDLLQSLINRSLHRMLRVNSTGGASLSPSRPPLPGSQEAIDDDVSAVEVGQGTNGSHSRPLLRKAQAQPETSQTLKEAIEEQKRDVRIQETFRIPPGQQIIDQLSAVVTVDRGATTSLGGDGAGIRCRGHLILTTNYLLFLGNLDDLSGATAYNQEEEDVTMVIPAFSVRRMEKIYQCPPDVHSTIPLGFSESDPYGVTISTCHTKQLHFILGDSVRMSDRFSFRLKNVLLDNVQLAKDLLTPFLSALPSEQLILGEEKCTVVASGLDSIHPLRGSVSFPSLEIQKAEGERESILVGYWTAYFEDYGRNIAIIRTPLFGRLIRAGIPAKIRGEMWEVACGSIQMRILNTRLYKQTITVNKDRHAFAIDEIEKDLHRSLPEYKGFQSPDGIDRLRRVLTAYSWHDSDLGYCQAMNIVVAGLLVYASEEQTFFLLKHLCETAIVGYYSQNMYGAILDQKVFEVLVSRHLPHLSAHLQACDMHLSVATMPWFLTLFINSMPLKMAMRILDWFFLDGPPVLFQISLAVLRINSDKILAAGDEGELVQIFRQYFTSLESIQPRPSDGQSSIASKGTPDGNSVGKEQLTNFQVLMMTAYSQYSDIVGKEVIALLRSEHQLKVIKGIEEYAKKTTIRDVIDNGCHLDSGALSYFYDSYKQVIFYESSSSNQASHHSSGLDFEGFLSLLSGITTWGIFTEEKRRATYSSQVSSGGSIGGVRHQRTMSSLSGVSASAAHISNSAKPTAIVKVCGCLFNRYLFEKGVKSHTLRFHQLAALLSDLVEMSADQRADILFDSFSHEEAKGGPHSSPSGEPRLTYDQLISVTEAMLQMSRNQGENSELSPHDLEGRRPNFANSEGDEDLEDIAGISQLLKVASSIGKGLLRNDFKKLIASVPSVRLFLGPDFARTIRTSAPLPSASKMASPNLKGESVRNGGGSTSSIFGRLRTSFSKVDSPKKSSTSSSMVTNAGRESLSSDDSINDPSVEAAAAKAAMCFGDLSSDASDLRFPTGQARISTPTAMQQPHLSPPILSKDDVGLLLEDLRLSVAPPKESS